MIEVPRGVIETAAWEAGLGDDAIRARYSGRGMYGRECFGIVGDLGQLIEFTIFLVTGGMDVGEWLPDVRSDSMGLSTIWYWPNVQIEQADEEE